MSLKLEIKGVVLNMRMPHKLDRSQKTKKNSEATWIKWVESASSFSYCSYSSYARDPLMFLCSNADSI